MKRGRPFEPGNKLGRGRPPGSRNKKTLIIQEILAKEDRRLREKIKAGRRRVEEARRARGELAPPPSGPLAEARRLRFLQAMTGYRLGREAPRKMWKDKAP